MGGGLAKQQARQQHCDGGAPGLEPFKLKFQEVASPEQVGDTASFLITQPVERVGFYEDGSMAASVTHAVTEELEKRRMVYLREKIEATIEREKYERWA